MQHSDVLELQNPFLVTGKECGEKMCTNKRERDRGNDVVDQYLFTSPCCYVEQVQHQRQQYVGFTIAWGIVGCMFKSNNIGIHACTQMCGLERAVTA